MAYKSYGVRLNDEIPTEHAVINRIEEYKSLDRRNNLKYLLIDLVNDEIIIENQPSNTDANFAELFNWLGQLPDFMKELKKQLVAEVVGAIVNNGGHIEFGRLPDLVNDNTRRQLDEASRLQQATVRNLMELE